jgi:hypothetical protein
MLQCAYRTHHKKYDRGIVDTAHISITPHIASHVPECLLEHEIHPQRSQAREHMSSTEAETRSGLDHFSDCHRRFV